MTSIQFLEVLKREIADFYFEDKNGLCKSTLGALELVELFEKQIRDETINDFLNIYKTLVPDHEARAIAADRLSRKYENTKNALVECR